MKSFTEFTEQPLDEAEPVGPFKGLARRAKENAQNHVEKQRLAGVAKYTQDVIKRDKVITKELNKFNDAYYAMKKVLMNGGILSPVELKAMDQKYNRFLNDVFPDASYDQSSYR